MNAVERVLRLHPCIRYVALYRDGFLISRQRDDVANPSADESDRYEELIVNPALLTLARQRGNIDCGGARFVVVGYGRFLQLVLALDDGHVSVTFENGSDPLKFVDAVAAAVEG